MRSDAVINAADAATIQGVGEISRLRDKVRDYALLTKPRIVLLFALTGLAAQIMEGTAYLEPIKMFAVFVGMVLTAGSANALNQYYDRDIDAVMNRTRVKRPIPAGRVSPQGALIFSIVTGVVATALLWWFGNALAASIGVFTIFFYVCIYTMWLKRTTPYNIVIGGAAGATAPLIGWAASSGSISLGAFIMFLIIFIWTPPHFWALALCVKDDYKNVSVPMLPVVAGEDVTRDQIFWYSVGMVPVTLLLYLTKDSGIVYLASALVLGGIFLKLAAGLRQKKDTRSAWKLFGYSIVYLLVLYTVMIIDALVR